MSSPAVNAVRNTFASYASAIMSQITDEMIVTAGDTVVTVLIHSTKCPVALSQRESPPLEDTLSAWEKKKAKMTRIQKCQPRRTCLMTSRFRGLVGSRRSDIMRARASAMSSEVKKREFGLVGVPGRNRNLRSAMGMVQEKQMI